MTDLPEGFNVFDKCCDECLFSDNKIVSDKRKKEVLKDCLSGVFTTRGRIK